MELYVRNTIKSPLSIVYKALSDAVILSEWFTTNAKIDLKVGGMYSNDDGDKGTFLEIKENELLKFTWDNSEHCPGTTVSIEFETLDEDETEVTLVHYGLANDMQFKDMQSGWGWALTNLQLYLEEGKKISYEEWSNANTK